MTIDTDARKLKVSNSYAHTLLWHWLDGVGGAITVPNPLDAKLPSHRYVILFENADGTLELVAQDERPEAS